MLIYNFYKEFLGIDEHDLKALGFSNLAELRAESEDFANLFVRTPGYVHNFKHVHWIDYISCTEEGEESKVIIHAKDKNYKCTLVVKTAYLVDNPSNKAYIITLQNLRALTSDENALISSDVDERELPEPAHTQSQTINIPKTEHEDKKSETNINIETTSENIQDTQEQESVEIQSVQESSPSVDISQEYDIDAINKNQTAIKDEIIDDSPIDINLDAEDEIKPTNIQPTQAVEETIVEESNYVYDPHIASDELGLPLDLIEEFLEDFINQANDFKDGLYTSLDNGNLTEVKALSHKLKGVAANLRIEDAKDALIIINTSEDIDEIKNNLNLLYRIVSKLANKNTKPQNIEVENTANPPLYDKLAIAKEIGLDMENFNSLFKDFIKEAKNTTAKINSAIANNDVELWKQNSVKLRSISDNMRVNLYSNELEEIINTSDSQLAKKALDTIDSLLIKIGDE